ncbi:hypothetical protein DPMN_018202 [Dreissena polymorpha]|uniref:Uncharacterized protein n=1 Tax=Dreissena polymorpha TaxID=45954 RepID=A0A9D4S827_DREPO|nr:hypothetical protein DPMN_018202 [Dreissena polymorpha]
MGEFNGVNACANSVDQTDRRIQSIRAICIFSRLDSWANSVETTHGRIQWKRLMGEISG